MHRVLGPLCLAAAILAVSPLQSETPKPDAGDPLKTETALKQERLARQFREFEQALLRMAQRLERSGKPEDRERAGTLRKAIELASAQGVDNQFDKLITILASKNTLTTGEITTAIGQNQELLKSLREILALLSLDSEAAKLKEEERRLTQLLKELDRVIRAEKLERAKVESGRGDPESLSKSQNKVTKETEDLAKAMGKKGDKAGDPKKGDKKPGEKKGGDQKPGEKKDGDKKGDPKPGEKGDPKKGDPKDGDAKKGDPKGGDPKDGDPKKGDPKKGDPKDGKPQEGQPQDGQPQEQRDQQQQQQQQPEAPGRQRVQDATEDQKKAEEDLKKNDRSEASKKQDEAIKKLEEARKELEKRLKQIREEELERVLANLQQRCERMLAMQIEVYEGTKRVDAVVQAAPNKKPGRNEEQKSLQLSDREREIVAEADKAIKILEAEGSAVAFPKFFEGARDDMVTVRDRLEKADTGDFTQKIEEDIIATLKEMIAALKKAQQDLKNPPPPPPPGSGGQPPPQKLLDLIAELKLIRSMQLKVNGRTVAYSARYSGEQADDPMIQKELHNLAVQQQKLEEVLRNIAAGRNEQ